MVRQVRAREVGGRGNEHDNDRGHVGKGTGSGSAAAVAAPAAKKEALGSASDSLLTKVIKMT